MCDRRCSRGYTCAAPKSVGQSKKMSLAETCVSTAIGYVVAIASQYVIFPMFDIYVSLGAHMAMGVFFTVVSVARGYLVRRLFNRLHTK